MVWSAKEANRWLWVARSCTVCRRCRDASAGFSMLLGFLAQQSRACGHSLAFGVFSCMLCVLCKCRAGRKSRHSKIQGTPPCVFAAAVLRPLAECATVIGQDRARNALRKNRNRSRQRLNGPSFWLWILFLFSVPELVWAAPKGVTLLDRLATATAASGSGSFSLTPDPFDDALGWDSGPATGPASRSSVPITIRSTSRYQCPMGPPTSM